METGGTTQKKARTSSEPDEGDGSNVSVTLTNLDFLDCKVCFEPFTIPVFQDEGDGSNVSVTLTNLDVLDCKVCFEPFTIPVFQCKNGHAACQICCNRLESKCPICKLKINIKNRALEEVIESVKVPCKNKDYGCKEFISYCNKTDHEKSCTYQSYPCPQPSCNFRGLSNQLSDHFCSHHACCTVTFCYYHPFQLALSKNQKTYVLKEKSSGDLFVLNNTVAYCSGNKIRISFVSPSPPLLEHSYELKASTGRDVLKFDSFTHHVRSISDEPLAPALLDLNSELLKLELKLLPVSKSVDEDEDMGDDNEPLTHRIMRMRTSTL